MAGMGISGNGMSAGKRMIYSLVLCCIAAGPTRVLLLAAIYGGHHVPASQARCISHGKGSWLDGSLSSRPTATAC